MTEQKIFFLVFRFLLLGISIVRSCLSSDRTREVRYRTHPLFLQFLLLLFSISLFLTKIHRSRGWKRTSEIIGGQEAGGRFDEMSNANPGYILFISFRLLLLFLASKLRGFASSSTLLGGATQRHSSFFKVLRHENKILPALPYMATPFRMCSTKCHASFETMKI